MDEAMQYCGVNHVALVCRDMAETVEFYAGVLEMPPVDGGRPEPMGRLDPGMERPDEPKTIIDDECGCSDARSRRPALWAFLVIALPLFRPRRKRA